MGLHLIRRVEGGEISTDLRREMEEAEVDAGAGVGARGASTTDGDKVSREEVELEA